MEPDRQTPRTETEIEVTPAMIDAGEAVLWSLYEGDLQYNLSEDSLKAIYRAMALASV